MTVQQLSSAHDFPVLVGGDALSREITSVYSCDLLSFVMGRAPADSAWVTVMGNVNAMAVALLADVSCVILAEGAALDADARQKAEQNDIIVLASADPVFETALAVHRSLTT